MEDNKLNNKKVALSLLILLSIVACFGIFAEKLKKDESSLSSVDYAVKTFKYNGHDYIEFFKGGQFTIVHDPDCQCNNK